MTEITQDVATDDDFAESVVPPAAPPPGQRAVAIVKQIRPWHKPRKQLVRRSWTHHIRDLMRRLHFPKGAIPTFRYLTLAGPDMLDIRQLEDATVKSGYKLKYTGFSPKGSKDEAEILLAQNQIRSYEWIDRNSETLWHRLEDIAAGERSTALRAVERHGPYHAINFDLCQNITLQRGGAPTIIDALIKVFRIQCRHNSEPWLLFITTKIEQGNTPDEHVANFLKAVNSNIAASAEFQEEFNKLCEAHEVDQEIALENPKNLPLDAFVRFFCLGFTKWLIGNLCTARPAIALEMQSSQIYSVEQGSKDMLSLVYKCSPQVRTAFDQGPEINHEEVEIAAGITAAQKTTSLIDIDLKVANDANLLNDLTQETHNLLRSANYSQELISQVTDNAHAQ
ncbi:hypothetical protein N7650_16470 [Pseudomonas sp. GD04058]|uniref:PP_RS20740 family protein n=1 Tax=Pseudomonas sp. GD04058 TaxID=2975429 RepID=UPI002446B5FE|nr:hypothetical protein [Pseudomonas sp. GD04058]MDG9884434.1 hypothetical protein [Pseudomonas sp. GD04058]